MGVDGLKVGAQIMKYATLCIRLCYRSVCNYPFVVGLLLFVLFLYRSFPFMFSLLVSTSPVLVCTAVLLGTLLSFGESNVEEDEKSSRGIVLSKTGGFDSSPIEEENECFSREHRDTEVRREIVKTIDEEPLLESTSDRLDKSEISHDDVGFSLMSTDYVSREARLDKQWIDKAKSDIESTEIEEMADLREMSRIVVGVCFNHGENIQTGFSLAEKVQAEQFEDYKSAEGSVDFQMRDHLVSSSESHKQSDEVLDDSLLSDKEVQHENLEDYESAEGSFYSQIGDQLVPPLASWKEFDDRSSIAQEIQERFEGYNLGEGSSEAQMKEYLELSLQSWKQLGSDHGEDGESDSGSDGAESSSPDASMADIIPMLDELHPLLDDENPHASKLSSHCSAATIEGLVISPESSIHSDGESDQKEDEADDGKSDVDDDNEEETLVSKVDTVKSVIMWTEDDQKNLMDLGTSELERNQRLESLIARRRARKMAGDRNLIDLDGMDLTFPVAPISTRRHNPFDLPQDSYADLGLPPIPGSAPSIMLSRRNPFDLPYDSSEEKPDLTEDSFQQEFTELTQREAVNQREALFRRNETFNMGSSGFDFGRPSRFRPYFVPERTDSDMPSYSSLQRQLSELSESKASSAVETESISAGADLEEKKLTEHDFAQEVEPSLEIDYASVLVEPGSQSSEGLDSLSAKDFALSELEVELGSEKSSPAAAFDVMSYTSLQRYLNDHSDSKACPVVEKESTSVGADEEEMMLMELDSAQRVKPSSEIDHASCLVENGSQSSEDLDSLSDGEIEKKDFVLSVLEVELGRGKSSSAAMSSTSETVEPIDIRLDNREINPALESWLSHSKLSHSDIQSMTGLNDVDLHMSSSPLSAPKAVNNEEIEDADSCLVNREKSQVNDLVNVDILQKKSLESSVSEVTTGLSLESTEFCHATVANDNHPKGPIFDLSPLTKNHSLSSFSSDLQRETSGIDLYHLSRDLFVVEELNVQKQVAENIINTKHDADGTGLPVNDNNEGSGFARTGFFPKLNQFPVSSQPLVVAADEDHQSLDSSEGSDGKWKDKVSDDIVSPHEVGIIFAPEDPQIFAQEDGAEIHLVNKLDDVPSADRQEFAEDPILVQEKKEVPMLADNHFAVHSGLFSSQFELEDEIQEEMEEQPIFHRKLEEIDQVNKIDEPVNSMVREPLPEIFSDPGESNVSSFLHEASESAFTELAIGEHVQDILETRHANTVEENYEALEGLEGLIADELIMYEEKNGVKEMDEALLSELDAVGDFRVSNVVPNTENSMINLNALNCTIPAEVVGDIHTKTEMPFGHEQLLGDISHVRNFEYERKASETNVPATKKLSVDSFSVNVTTGLLDLETQSVEDINAASVKFSEEVQNSVVAESVQADFIRKVEVHFPETELLLEVSEPTGCTTEVVTVTDDTAFYSRESTSDRIQSDLTFPALHDLVPDGNEIVSGLPILDAKIIEKSDDHVEKDEAKFDRPDFVEAVNSVTETGVDSVESMPLQIHRDIEGIDESPLVEASNAPDLEPSYQTESVRSIEFDSLLFDRNINEQESLVLDANDSLALESEDGKEAPRMPVLGASVAPAVESQNLIETNTYEPLLWRKKSKDIQESIHVGVSVESTLNSEHQMEKFDSSRSESLQIDGEVKETQEFLAHERSMAPAFESEDQIGNVGSSKALQVDEEVKEIQELSDHEGSIDPASESEDHNVKVWSSESMQIDEEVKETLEFLAHEESITPVSESEYQREKIGSFEPSHLDRDILEVQESYAVEASISSSLEPEEIEVFSSEECGPLQRDRVMEQMEVLQHWHAVKGIASIAPEPLQIDTDIDYKPKSPTVQTGSHVPKSVDLIFSVDSLESGQLLVDTNGGELHNVPAVEPKIALAVESEGQLEQVGFVETEPLQKVGDCEEILESPVLHKNHVSAIEFQDQKEMISRMDVVEVQTSQDYQLVSQEQPEVDVSNGDDLRGIFFDSSATETLSTNNETNDQVNGKSAAESVS